RMRDKVAHTNVELNALPLWLGCVVGWMDIPGVPSLHESMAGTALGLSLLPSERRNTATLYPFTYHTQQEEARMHSTPTAEDLLMGSMLMSDQIRHDAYARGITPDTLQSTQLKELLTVVQDMDNLELPVEAVAIRNHATRMGYDILTDFVTDLRGAAVDNPQVIQSYSYYVDLVLENARKVRAVKAAQSVIEKFQRDP